MTTEQRVSRWIKTHGYGLSYKELKSLIRKHKNGTEADKEFVEALLTDINFHAECSALCRGYYETAYQLAEEFREFLNK